MPDACPSREELARFLRGRVDSSDMAPISLHLESCDACNTLAGELEAEVADPLQLLPQALPRMEPGSAPFLRIKAELIRLPKSRAKTSLESETTPDLPRPFGPYLLLRVLGQGGMGRVYLARHERMRRLVAIKLIRPAAFPGEGPSLVARFEREIHAAALVQHPGVVIAHDAGEIDGQLYLAMEYIEGEDLGRIVSRQGPLPVDEALRIVRLVAEGLDAANEAGIVHRDVKPSNIMLSATGEPKLLDLGVARLLTADSEQISRADEIVGTFHFMAPEQAGGSTVDRRADVYGLAATLFKLLTGKPPIGENANSPLELVAALLRDIPPRLDAVLPEVPCAIADVVARALAKDPSSRPESVAEFSRQLDTPLDQERPSNQERPAAGNSGSAVTTPRHTQSAVPQVTSRSRSRTRRLALAALISTFIVALLLVSRDQQSPTAPAPENVPNQNPSTSVAAVSVPNINGQLARTPSASPLVQHRAPAAEAKPERITTRIRSVSPLDALDPSQIPPTARRAWHPSELVAVIGDERHTTWGPIQQLAFRQDGQWLAGSVSDDADTVAVVWSTRDLEPVATLDRKTSGISGDLRGLGLFPDGRLATVEMNGKIRIWSLGSSPPLELERRDDRTLVVRSVLSLDGRWLAVASADDHTVRLFNPARLADAPVVLQGPRADSVSHVTARLTPDGRFACLADQRGNIILYDLSPSPPVAIATHQLGDGVREHWVGLSHDGRTLAVRDDSEMILRLIDARSGLPVPGFTSPVLDAGPNDPIFLGPENDELLLYADGIRRVPLGAGHPSSGLRVGSVSADRILELAATPDGRYWASNSHGGERLRLWEQTEARNAREAVPLSNSLAYRGVTFSQNGQRVGLIAVEEANAHFEMFQPWIAGESALLPSPARESASKWVHQIRFSLRFDSDGRDENTAELLKRVGNAFDIRSLQFTPSALRPPRNDAAAWSKNGELHLAQLAEDNPTQVDLQHWPHGSPSGTTAVAFSPSGRLLVTIHSDSRVILWDATARPPQTLREFTIPRTTTGAFVHQQTHLAFPTDDTKFAFSGDGVWEWRIDQPAPRRLAVDSNLWCVRDALAYSPEGKFLLIAGLANPEERVILWNTETDSPVRVWPLPGAVRNVAFAHDGRHIGWVNANGSAYILRLSATDSE